MITTTKTAHFLRELDRGGADWLRAFLFKVTPAMEWVDHITYRKGKILHDPVHGFPNRLKRRVEDGTFLKEKPRAIYTYGQRRHSTAFVVASCSDLKTMMGRSNRRMRENAQESLKYFEALEPSSYRDKGIAREKETIRLFKPEEDERFEVETYLFPADKLGEIKNMGEMHGSQRKTLDPRVVFESIGYEVMGYEHKELRYKKEPIELQVEVVP